MLLQLLLSLNQVDHFEGLANGMTVPLGTLCLGQAQDLLQTLALECEEVLQCLVVSHFFSAPLRAIVHIPCWRCFWGSEAAQPFGWCPLLLLLQPGWVGGWVGSNGKWERVSGPSKASPGMPRHPPHPTPHTPTSTHPTPALRMQPHWQESWPAGQALCPASPEPTSGWAAGGFYSASGSWIGYPQCLWSKGGSLLDEEWAMVLASRTKKLPSISRAFLSCWLAILHLRALRAYVCLASGDGTALPSGCWWHTRRGLNQVFVSASYQLLDHLGLRLGQDAYGVHVPAKVARFHAAWTDPASLLGAGSHGIAMLHGCMQVLCLAVVVRPAANVLVINM